jgi:hypothetical protein
MSEVYSTTIDKKFSLRVTRVKPYEGKLVLSLDGKSLLEKDVTISYDAMVGPDVGDVDDWVRIATDFIDTEYKP